jgi:glycosyltransferase involved in cell wall biosynthesis
MYGGVTAEIVSRAITDKPLVITYHGSDLLGEPFSSLLNRVSARYGVFASHLAARRADAVIVVSWTLLKALPNRVESRKVWIIPCGIDLERFKPLDMDECRLRLGWTPNDYHILFSSKATNPVKRFDLAQSAAARIKQMGFPIHLHEIHGVFNEEVPIWLNASDVLVLTSIHEGSPTIVKEALACNRPVVSVDVGDVHKHIEGIANCYLAFPDPDDLAMKLLKVLEGSRRSNGRQRMQELSLDRIALRLDEVYRAVMERSKR